MDSTLAEQQQQEITALKSIYAEDFIECQPRAWKGAVRLPEFIIKIAHPDIRHAPKIYFHLHTIFPKTYPANAHPIFTVQQPIQGISEDRITKLSNYIQSEAKQSRGTEIVFQVITAAQDWIATNISPPAEVVGSLASEMIRRATEEERAKREREEARALEEAERKRLFAEAFNEQMQADAQRHQMEREKHKARHRAQSDATEVPELADDTLTQSFDREIVINGLHFRAVKLFHPRSDCLGTVYQAEPICDDVTATLPLEVHLITFDTQYYATHQGRKKLKFVQEEIQRLMAVRHINVVGLHAVKLTLSSSSSASQLAVLMDQKPQLTLQDILEDSDTLREERATSYLTQILAGLNEVHSAELVHRGLSLHTIGLSSREKMGQSKLIKLFKVGYYVKLLDLHRSNPFRTDLPPAAESMNLSESWLAKDAQDSTLIYTKGRDIHYVGVVFLQMLLGRDVVEHFPDAQAALTSSSISPALQRIVLNMVSQKKKYSSCATIVAELADTSFPKPRSISIPVSDVRTPIPHGYGSSPEVDYFRMPVQRRQQVSRWKEDWEELELLGRGAFGSVVKARNKIDSRIYAVKKVRLRTPNVDNKILREINALSRLSHRFIVRYYTAWFEDSEPISTTTSSYGSGDDTADGITSVPNSMRRLDGSSDPFNIDLDELGSNRSSSTSFPSIHFTGSDSGATEGSDGDTDGVEIDADDLGEIFEVPQNGNAVINVVPRTPPAPRPRTLYIQMEFVERQTLRERIAEGLRENEAWGLFQQIVDALVHMSSMGILHRDIKLTNIFIDGKGDCKIGDFGLATSSLAALEQPDLSPHCVSIDAEMTLEVGTRLYIAPEVQSPKKGPRNHTKADLYSLGIVFFEMNYFFSTGAERIAVIEGLRKREVNFPSDWDALRTRQRQIITWLLQHNPDNRPTALELSQSSLLPSKIEDEYFKGALRMMSKLSKADSPHRQAVLQALFSQNARGVRGFLYDSDVEHPEHASLNGIVRDTLSALFRLHGAIEMEPPLMMPIMDSPDEANRALFVDKHGEVVGLPNNALVPFARVAARNNLKRIKRFHIGDIYRPSLVAGHPRVSKAAVLDIISTDIANGGPVSIAELIIIINECLDTYPSLSQHYEIHISHSKIIELALNRVPHDIRDAVVDIILQTRSTWAQKRSMLLKKGLLRSTVDELEVFSDTDDDIEAIVAKLERVSQPLSSLLSPCVDDIKKAVQFATLAGVSRPIYFQPLMVSSHNSYFKDGVCFEVVRRNKRGDILAVGGRYDDLIAQFSPPKLGGSALCAVGLQISLEKILIALAAFQAVSVKNLLKEQRSFGFWSPRRCDVYIVSYQPGYLSERLEVAALLWRHNISADMMYETSLPDGEHENHLEICHREGILFSVCPRPRSARRDQPAFKIKSILKGTEYDVSRAELVPWLQEQIAEQKRLDADTSGAAALSEGSQGLVRSKSSGPMPEVQLILPGDTRKQRKQTKQIFLEKGETFRRLRANPFEMGVQIRSAVQSGLPIVAVDTPANVFDALCKSSNWVTDDEPWKAIASSFPLASTGYAPQIREAVSRRRAEGHRFILLFAVRDERVHLLTLS
ncbi:kinase-like domain-containing protein [Gloeopeniophorella convolvens]|nr:kinase-like domain-containing protein [Gloeopeniophorella convolvens]